MPVPIPSRTTMNYARAFQAFLQTWLIHQESLMNELMILSDNNNQTSTSSNESQEGVIRSLITRVLSHYQEYFEENSRMVNRNPFLMLSPFWLTPFEKAFLWLGGFKPGLALSIAFSKINDLTPDQVSYLENLKTETRIEEKLLLEEFARIQETVALPSLVDRAREDGARGPRANGEVREVDSILESLKSAMENLIIQADMFRTETAEKVVGILTPMQTVRFFAAAAQLQLRIRSVGIQKEAERVQHAARQDTAATPANGW